MITGLRNARIDADRSDFSSLRQPSYAADCGCLGGSPGEQRRLVEGEVPSEPELWLADLEGVPGGRDAGHEMGFEHEHRCAEHEIGRRAKFLFGETMSQRGGIGRGEFRRAAEGVCHAAGAALSECTRLLSRGRPLKNPGVQCVVEGKRSLKIKHIVLGFQGYGY